MTLTHKQKRILRGVGYPLLALVVFSFTLQLSFPYERLKDRLVEVASERYDVQIASIEPTFLPGGVILENILLKTRPTRPDEEPTALLVERLRVDLGLLALLRSRADVDIEAHIGEGSIEGNLVLASNEIEAHFATDGLTLDGIPGLRAAVGLPMQGGLDAELDVILPEQRWDLAEGSFTLSCPECVIGDGKSKIKPRRRSARRRSLFAGEGLTVPALNLGDLHGKVVFRDGRGIIEELGAQSVDGDLALHGSIELGRRFSDARFAQACMKFRLSDGLKQREPEFGNVPSLMGAPPESDGYSNVRMTGKLSEMRWIAARTCEEDGSAESLRSGSRTRVTTRIDGERGRPTLPADDADEGGAQDGSGDGAGDLRARDRDRAAIPGEDGPAAAVPPLRAPTGAARLPDRRTNGESSGSEDVEDQGREQEREQRAEQLIEEREQLEEREGEGASEDEPEEGAEREDEVEMDEAEEGEAVEGEAVEGEAAEDEYYDE